MSERTQQLVVDAGNPAVRIDVLDHAFRLKASAYGRIEETLPTGLYTVRYQAADAREERDVTLRPGGPVVLDEPPELAFASPAPIGLTWTSHEYHQAAAEQLSRDTPLALGSGAECFVFVRDVDPGGRGRPARRLSLHDQRGEVRAELGEVAITGGRSGEAAWAGRNLALDPGSYRLRVAIAGRRSVEMMLHLVGGWQTQVFLLRGGGRLETNRGTFPDLAGATQLMAPTGMGFEANSRVRRKLETWDAAEDLRLAELARHALAEGTPGIARGDMRSLLESKWLDPLLGIYGVHLILMRDEADLDLAESITGRLRGIVGDIRHPDIDVLELEIARRQGGLRELPPFETPPMLRRGWQVLVEESARQPHLIPKGSLVDQLVGRLWGSGAWLVWTTPQHRPERPPADLRELSTPTTVRGRIEDHGDHILIGNQWLLVEDYEDTVAGMGAAGDDTEPQARPERRPRLSRRVPPHRPLKGLARRSPLLARLLREVPTDPSNTTLAKAKEKLCGMLAAKGYDALREVLERLAAELGARMDVSSSRLANLASSANLSASERALLVYLLGQMGTRGRSPKSAKTDPLALDTLVHRLSLPASHVIDAVAALLTKLAVAMARK